jgi:hypothetical protein
LCGAQAGLGSLAPARLGLEDCRATGLSLGRLIDPWHLAALTEGLLPRRLAGARSLAEAGEVFEAGRAALALHRWLTAPDDDQEAQIGAAETALRQDTATGVALVDAAAAAWRWLEAGGARAPLRAALPRHWMTTGLLRTPLAERQPVISMDTRKRSSSVTSGTRAATGACRAGRRRCGCTISCGLTSTPRSPTASTTWRPMRAVVLAAAQSHRAPAR